jgi:hypothetical protein
MSIDFMVFDPRSAPRDHRAFRSWYYEQTDWPDDYDHDPSVTTPAIQSWYRQMSQDFPDANVPEFDSRATDERYGDYNFGKHICYVAFRPNVADEAWARVRPLPPITDWVHTILTATTNAAATQSASLTVRIGQMCPSAEAYAASSARRVRLASPLATKRVTSLMSAMGGKRT